MAFLPIGSLLGDLKLVEVYEFYDIPRLFSAVNPAGQLFLAVNYDDFQNSTKWYYLPISRAQFNQAKSSSIDIRTAFLSSELGYIWDVLVTSLDGTFEINTLSVDEIDHENLPDNGEFLLPDPEIDEYGSIPLLPDAIAGNRECINVRFLFKREERAIAPIRHLGNFAVSFQQLVDDLSAHSIGVLPKRGRLPTELLHQSELCVAGQFVASFGLNIVASNKSDMFKDSIVQLPLETIANLFDGENAAKNIKGLLFPLGARCASKYRILLEQISVADADIQIEHASPKTGFSRKSYLSVFMARAIIAAVKQFEEELSNEYIIPCTLTAFHSRTGSFEVESIEDGQRIPGKIAPDAIPLDLSVVISNTYNATIQESTDVSAITGEKHKRFKLLWLENFDPND